MLTQLAIKLLSNVLAGFVKEECFSPDLLQVGIWSGHVELTNLELKEDILDLIGLPIGLRYARIGSIDITVPWKFLGLRPVKVIVEDIYVLAYAKYEWDAATMARRREARKLAQVQASYAAEQPPEQKRRNSGAGSGGGGGASLTELLLDRVLNSILDSLQVEVRNVHLRFEDLTSSPTQPYCLGLTLEAFSLGSMSQTPFGRVQNPNAFLSTGGGRVAMPGSSEQVTKLVQLRSLSVYCNPIDDDNLNSMALHVLDKDSEIDLMLTKLVPGAVGASESLANRLGRHRFILHPTNMLGEFLLDKRDVVGGRTRVVVANCHVQELKVTLEDHLLRAMVCLSAGLIRFKNMDELGLDRPTCSVKEDVRAWWRYAYRVVLMKIHEQKSKWDFDDMMAGRKDRLLYLELWTKTRRRMVSNEASLMDGSQQAMEEWEATGKALAGLERRLSTEKILAYRRMGDAQLAKEGFKQPKTVNALSSWQQYVVGGTGSEIDSLLESQPEYVSFAVQVEASLSSGVVSLAAGKSSSEFMRLTLQGLVVRAGAEGTDGPKFANVSLQNLTVLSRNMDAEGGSPSSWWRPAEGEAGPMAAGGEEWQPLLCRRGQSAGPLFRVEVELCPSGSQYQALIKLDMDKTEVCFVPEAPWLASIQQFIDLPDMADSWAEVETLALAQVYLLQEEMPAKLEYILRTHFRARLDVSMKGPLLRLLPPSNPDMSPAQLWSLPEIHCDMGHLTLTSVEHGSGPSKPAMADEDGHGPLPPDDMVLDGSTHARMNGGVVANGQEGKASPVLLPPEPPDAPLLPSPVSSPTDRAYDDHLYDVYRLDIQGIRVFVAPRAEPGVLRPSTRTLPLLDPLHVTATVYNSRLPADPGIMRFRLHLHISDVHMRLSEAVIRSLARLGPCYLKSKERAEREMERLRLKVEDAMRRGTSMTRLQSFVRTNGSLHRPSISGTRVSSGSLFSASFKDAATTEASSLPSRRSSSMLGRASMLLPSHSPDRASMFSANEDDFYSIGGFDDAASVASYRSHARSSRGQLCSPPLLPSSLEDGVDLAHLALNEVMDDDHHYDSAEEGDDDLDYAAYAEADAAAPLSREASGPAAAMLPALLGKSSSGGSGARHLSEVVDAVRAAGRRGLARRRSSLKRSLSEVSVNRKHVDATVQIDSVRLSISRDQRRDAGVSPSSWGGGGGGGEEEHKGSPRMEGFVSLASLGGDHPEAPLLALTVLGVGLTAYQTARCVRATFAVEDILLESVGDHAGTELRLMHIGPHSGSSAVEAGGGALAIGPSLLASPSLSRYSLLRPRGSFDAFGVPMKPPDLLAPPAAIETSLVVELDPEQLLPFRELRSDTKLGIVSFFLDQRPVVSVLEVLEPLVSMSKDLSQSMGTSPPRPHRLEPPPTHPTPAAPESTSNVAAWRRLPRVNVSFEMKSFRATVVGAEASHPRAALCLTGAIIKLYPSGLKRGATTFFSMELEDMRLAIDDAINSSPVMARKASPTSSPHCFVLEAEVRTTLLFGLPPSALRPTTPNTAEGAAISPLSLPTASPTGLDVDELDVTLSVRLSHIRFFCPACALLRFARGVLDGPLMAKARQEAQKLQQQQQQQQQQPGASSSSFADARGGGGGGSPARPATSGAAPSALPSPKVSFTFVAAELGFVLPIEDDGQNGCPVAHHGLTLELGRLEVGGLWLGPGKELEGSLEGSDWSVEQVAGSRHSKLVGLAGLAFEGRELDGGLDGELRLAVLTLTVDDAAVVFVKRLMEYVDGVLERDLPALLPALDTASGTTQPAPLAAPTAARSPARQAPPPLSFQRFSLRIKGDGVYVHLAVPKEPSMLLLSSELVLSLSGISLVSVVELMADASGGVLPRDAQLELAMESIGLSLEHHDHRRAQWGQSLRLLHKDVTLLEAERLGGVDEAKAESQPAASSVPGDEEDDDASPRSRPPALLPSQHVCMSAHLSLQDQARELELAFRCQPSQWTVGLEAARAVSKTMDAFAAVFASPEGGPPPSTATTAPPLPAPSQARPPPPSVEALLLDYLSGRAPDKTAALQAVQRSLTAMMPFQLTRVALDVAVSTQSLCIREEPSDSSTAPGSQGFVHSLVLEAGLGLQCQVMACYEVEPGGSQLLAGLEVQVDVSGVDWQVVARRTPRQPLMVLTGGVEAGLPSEDDTLVSPLAWDVRVDVRLPLSDSQEEAATCLPVLVTAEIKAIEACVLLDSRSLEHLASSTLLPIADVFSGQAAGAGAASASTSEAESARQVPTSEDYFVHKVPIATPDAEPALARSRSTVAPSAEPATSAPSWPDVTRLSVEVVLERLHVTVVDNLCSPSLPLLSLSGGPVTANLEGADGMLMGKIRLRLQSDAFNRRLVLWEPLLEPWSLRVELALGTLSSTGTLNRPGSRSSQLSAVEEAGPEADDRHNLLSVQVTATEVLQLNVTESFLETLLDSTSALSQASKAAGPASGLPPPSMPPSAPSTPSQRSSVLDHQSPQQPPSTMNLYWIRNDTGVLLHYRLEGHDSANGWRTVRPGYHEVLSSSLPLYQDGKHKRRRTVKLSLQRPGQDPWRPLTHVSYHDERTVLHSLETRGRHATAPIAVVTEVARTAGVKVLRVRSTAMLQNSCPLPVHVALRTPAQYGVIQWESSIEEGEEVPVPLYLAGLLDASLSLRMGSGRPVEVLMPSPQPDPETPDDDCLFLDMTVKGDKGKPTPLTYCCMRVRRGVNSQGQRSETITSDVRLISLNPPFVMGNFLPVPASFEIGMVPDRSYSPSKRGSDLLAATPLTLVKLRPGETFAWYGAASDRHAVTLKMKLTGSLWSKEVLIKPRFHPGAVEDLTVELQEDKAGPVLKAVAELAWDGRMRVLSVYVPFWLLNATTMGISYAHEKETTAEGLLAGQRGSKGGPSSTAILPSSEHPLSTQPSRPKGLLALLEAPPGAQSRTDVLVSRAQDHLIMAGFSSYSAKARQSFTRLRIRLDETAPWSKPFTLLPGASEGLVTTLELEDRPPPGALRSAWSKATRTKPRPARALGLSVSMWSAGGVFHRTRIVTVSPRLILVNAFGRGLEVRQDVEQASGLAETGITLFTAQRAPLYWADGRGPRFLRVRIREFGWEWSGKFSPDVEGDTTLRLRNTHNDVKCFMQVRVTLQEPSFIVSFRREPVAFAPYRIENRTLETVWFGQVGVPLGQEVLLPYHTCAYAWDEPSMDHVLELERQATADGGGIGGRREAMGRTDFNPIKVKQVEVRGSHLMLDVVTRGAIRVLVITDSRLLLPYRQSSSVTDLALLNGEGGPGPRRARAASTVDSDRAQGGSSSKPPPAPPAIMHVNVSAAGLGISLINSVPQELLYTSVLRIQASFTAQPGGSLLRVAVGHLQVDDQTVTTTSPIVFIGQQDATMPPPPAISASSLGTMEARPVERPDGTGSQQLELVVEQEFGHDRILFIRDIRVGLVPFYLRLDGNLVASLIRLATNVLASALFTEPQDSEAGDAAGGASASSSRRMPTLKRDVSLSRAAALPPQLQQHLRSCLYSVMQRLMPPASRAIEEDWQKVFIDSLAVDPIRINVSFRASSMVSNVVTHLTSGTSEQHRFFKAILDVITSVVSKVEDAPLRFSALRLEHLYVGELSARGVNHYLGEVKWQAYVLLGTLAAFGNPVSALANVSTGVRDFVFEPAKALSEGNLWHFYQGVYRGSHSLVTRLLLTSVESVRAVVSSGHAAILPLVMLIEDDGALTTHGSLQGMVHGFRALLSEPIRGLKAGGMSGFRNGLARGIISVGLRPLLGMLDDIIEICQMFTTVLDPHLSRTAHLSRVRPPRLFRGRNAALEVYSREANLVNDVLSRLCKGEFWREGYVWYDVQDSRRQQGGHCVVVTGKRVLYVRIYHRPRRYVLEWQVPLASLLHMDVEEEEEVEDLKVELHFFPTPALGVGEPGGWSLVGSSTRHKRAVAEAEGTYGTSQPRAATLGFQGVGGEGLGGMGLWLRRSIADSHPGLRIGHRSFVVPGKGQLQQTERRVRELVRGIVAKRKGVKVSCPWPLDGGGM